MALLVTVILNPAARADDSSEIMALQAEIQTMELKLSALEQKEMPTQAAGFDF